MSAAVRPADVRRRLALTVVLLGVVMTSSDNTVINVAVPSISAELHAGIAGTAWVVDAYLLTFATLRLTGGRLADTFGRRRVFLVGAGLFTGASLAAAMAFNPHLLIAARALQGAGAALLTPPTLAIILTSSVTSAVLSWRWGRGDPSARSLSRSRPW